MKKWYLMLCLPLVLTACGQQEENQEQKVVDKKVLTLSIQDCQVSYQFPAQLTGKQDINILPQVTAILEQKLVNDGDAVKKGQKMFVLAQTSFLAAVKTAEANVLKAEANLKSAQLNASSRQDLFAKGIISDNENQVAQNNLMMVKAQLSEAQAALVSARNDYSHTVITAPCDGMVGSINYQQGSLVGPTIQRPLTVLSDNSQIEAHASITEKMYLNLIRFAGSKDTLLANLPDVNLILSDGSTFNQKGRMTTMSGIVDEQTGAVRVKYTFPNPQGLLPAGGSASVQMQVKQQALVIPRSATFEIQNKIYAYRVKAEGNGYVAEPVILELERLNETEYMVTSGLNAGDRIVLEGVRKMTNNMPINPID